MRKHLLIGLASVLLSVSALPALGQDRLNVVSWDGAYVKSQVLGFIRPYEEATGIEVTVLQYSGGIAEIRRQVRAWNVHWDIVDLELFDAIRACEEGLLEKIDHSKLPPAPDGTPAEEDFIGPSLMPCGVGNVIGSTVVSFDPERLKKTPTGLADFFNLRDFPGRRGLRRSPQGNLEWALIADGVERERVYEVLDTDEGLERAFRVLNRIKPYIDWWQTGEDAVRLLETGQVAMTSIYSGRIHDAVQRGENFEILWDGQIWFYDVWGVPKNGQRTERALEFLHFATSTHSLARQANYIPYGPVRQSSMEFVDEKMKSMLPTAEQNMKTAIELNAQWWSDNMDRITQRWEEWLRRPVMVPRRLPR
jgi:putative spermidine/putrescine transport system substrate-binding protein